jgi:drug/metabolite transporter (DMT)-like permease
LLLTIAQYQLHTLSQTIRGALTILLASLCAGVGNAITGLTAHDYLSSGSLLSSIDIAVANTLGGLALVVLAYLVWIVILKKDPAISDLRTSLELRSRKSLVSGALKGANTCLFVISTTYIVATQSLIYESTYIVWSLMLAVAFLGQRAAVGSSTFKTVLMLTGVFLVSGETNLNGSNPTSGAVFGILAGLVFALYLFSWSFVTRDLASIRSKLVATGILLVISTVTILVSAEIASLVIIRTVWVPLTNLKPSDVLVQMINGGLVIGVVYLLLTTGMSALRSVREGASLIVAMLISFMIPFTLLTEFAIGKFVPTYYQLIGVVLFMAGFGLVGASLNRNPEKL